jgi:hypothetical protein
MKPNDRFRINTPAHKGRTYVVRTFDSAGVTAWDVEELHYREDKRTLYCIGRIPWDGFMKAKQVRKLTRKELANQLTEAVADLVWAAGCPAL